MGKFRYILANTAITDLLLGVVWSAIQNVKIKYCDQHIVVFIGYAKFFFGWESVRS